MLPETRQRLQREVNMDITLGASLLATKGYAAPEVGETYTSTQQLCQHLEDPYQLFPVLRGLWSYYLVRAELLTAHALGKQLLALAQQVQDAARLLAAHRALGATLFFLGTAASAYTHLAQALALYNPQQHSAQAFLYGEDTSVVCRSHAAWARWSLGYPVQGLARNDEALTLAQQIVHPYILGYVLNLAARFHQFRREVRLTQERAAALISLAQEQGFQYLMVQGSVLHGWALAQQGQARDGIEQMHQGLTAHHATGAELGRPYYLALLAQAYGIMGQADAGLKVLTEALTLADTTEERWYEAELHRLKGELLLQQNAVNQTEAETCFQQAIRIAQSQQAKSWELRATTSLARLWQQQGKRQEAYDLLAPVYHWFTEGFNTADLQGARALLEELS
jgi:predicted ATPase